MKDLTVLSPQIDPFRLDTPANHVIGNWLADTAATLGSGRPEDPPPRPSLHDSRSDETQRLRRTPTPRPIGCGCSEAGKAARWLGYIPFDQIFDHRNAPPDVRIFKQPNPVPPHHRRA